ncbi:MFS transporter [Myxosarcina sp. GI1]|uniref:MFS transporter n=1 Tax=Myxosarcina sp. GI1 TaxID=1541065 RepID=UPI000564379C|nr:MFS transporter [Myxosarcina sp. GI1]
MIDTSKSGLRSSTNKWWTILGIGLGVLMFSLDTSIVYIAMPTLVRVFDTDFTTVQGVVVGYTIVLTSFVLSGARLGDIFGRKRLYLVGLAVFTIGSLLCGLSQSIEWLIFFRVFQGLGAVFISGLGTAIVTEVFPDSERGRALGILGAIVATGIGVGPSIGGVLVGLLDWRAIFLVNVPIGIVAAIVVMRFVPKLKVHDRSEQFDAIGAIVLAVCLICFTVAMSFGQRQGFDRPIVHILLVSAVLGFLIFLAIEARDKQPMLELRLFRNLEFSLGLMTGWLVFIVIAGNFFVLPFLLEDFLNYSTLTAGLLLAAGSLAGGVGALLAGTLSDRFTPRFISLGGLIFMAAGCLLFSRLSPETGELGYMVRGMVFGFGLGAFQSPNNSAVMGEVSRNKFGAASGLLALSRSLGQTTGVSLLGAIFNAIVISQAHLNSRTDVTKAPKAALAVGFQNTFFTAAIILSLGIAFLLIAWWLDNKKSKQFFQQ